MKTTLLAVLVLIAAQTFAQSHEENNRSTEPAKAVQVYPNPAVEFLTLKFESPIAKSVKLEFHSIIGTTLELEHEAIDEYEVKVKVKDISAGYYFVGVHDPQSNSKAIHKFLKK